MSLAYLPNLLTVARLLLAGPIAWFLMTERARTSLFLFIVAGLTDLIDGWLARRQGWTTKLGAFLDPLADKILLTSIFLSLYYLGCLPRWVIQVALGRDAVIILGIVLHRVWIGPLQYQAIDSSKVNTAVQIILVALVLVQKSFGMIPSRVLEIASVIMAMTSTVSLTGYARLWIQKVRQYV